MSSRSERYLANAEKCQRCADIAYTSGTKRLNGLLASNWRRLAEEAEWTDKIVSQPLLEIRHADFLRQIDKAECAIQEFGKVLAANNRGPCVDYFRPEAAVGMSVRRMKTAPWFETGRAGSDWTQEADGAKKAPR
jgi:hypothetical protein